MRHHHCSPLNPLPELEQLPARERRRLYLDAQRDLTRRYWIVYTIVMILGIIVIPVLLEAFYRSRFNPDLPRGVCVAIGGGAGGGLMVLAQIWTDRRHIRPAVWRRLPHLCSTCGYDLTGNTSGLCPECGREVGPAAEAPGATASPEGEAVRADRR